LAAVDEQLAKTPVSDAEALLRLQTWQQTQPHSMFADGEDFVKPPTLPQASPIGDIACPLGPFMSPRLTTPAWLSASAKDCPTSSPVGKPGGGKLGGLAQIDQWAWEMGSEAGSVPSVWSKPSTLHSSVSRISTASGEGLIPGLIEGQRLSAVNPSNVPIAGGKVIVSLHKEVPQGYWDHVGIVLVNGPTQVKVKPSSIKKGKKLCIEVPSGLSPGDYDVRLSFNSKLIHGAIPLTVGTESEADGSDGEQELSQDLQRST